MNISQHLRGYFDAGVRNRAAAYRGLVRIVQGTPTGVSATVRGSSTYHVALRLEGNELHASCSCPYYEGAGACKHLWATILTAERHGHLGEAVRQSGLTLVFDDLEYDEDRPEDVIDFPEADDDDRNDSGPRRAVVYRPKEPKKAKQSSMPTKLPAAEWAHVFNRIKQSLKQSSEPNGAVRWVLSRQLVYIVDVPGSLAQKGIVVEIAYQERKQNGDWAKPKFQAISQDEAEQIRTEPDASIVSLLFGAQKQSPYGYSYGYGYASGGVRFVLSAVQRGAVLPLLGRSGRLFARFGPVKQEIVPIAWDEGPAWQFRIQMGNENGGKTHQVTGWMQRGDERQPITEPLALISGIALWRERAALFDDGGALAWVDALRREKVLHVPVKKQDAFLRDLFLMPKLPPVDLPEELQVVEERGVPNPRIVIRPSDEHWRRDLLHADVAFVYAKQHLPLASPERGIFDVETRRILIRDPAAEQSAVAFLHQQGFRNPRYNYGKPRDFELPARLLPRATRVLLEAGWQVEAEGKLYRRSGEIHIEVATSIDWFDLEGNVRFDDQVASLPRLLQALKRGESTIQLDDGTFGMLPEDWLKKYGMLAGLGTPEGDRLRFSRRQAGLLDALLASLPDVSFDDAFRQATQELRRFEGIRACDPPAEFVGTLREYQREGLGWLQFLERFGFGGCLADDMGLGKTVQVLADRRQAPKKGEPKLPTLIVVPRSLVFNWQQEAARFAPDLRVLDHTGLQRDKSGANFADFDVVVTTYGTLRRDVLLFKEAAFDYCILDEAQTVKNAGTDQAKAVRLLQARHRLALSGTPVENHLGELWSLFEFLNPGMLGHASIFKLAGGAARNPEPETRAIVAKGLRPFILRRTKNQVAKDLPEKTEQTLYCELEAEQRQLYDELREHYRQSLLKTIEKVGMNRAKIQVLEALLRLRQAACHPGLIDKKKATNPSAKLDVLIPHLQETIEQGQKTLVFSQFTSLLAFVRNRLDREGVVYEYLDGKTRNRAKKVERFQSDPACKLFLISLKAGGVGLNLTAAEYVFLLDPWWNPAVEAQAIDRTHRIGQTKPVFAYRIIARDTVEEKVLELQKTKRDLADAILNADNSVMSSLRREDLEMLLS
jgi:superfamily II DNA or RNA helicase